jgi:hypothetical protein
MLKEVVRMPIMPFRDLQASSALVDEILVMFTEGISRLS